MPCPHFEPQIVVARPERVGARLPLIDEYDGLCHATPEELAVPAELRFRCCNHGYSRGCCERIPLGEHRSSLRYDVVRRTTTTLELICIEEEDYAPLRWRSVKYVVANDSLRPEVDDHCVRAQAIAFCRSYLQRFP